MLRGRHRELLGAAVDVGALQGLAGTIVPVSLPS